MNEILKGGIYEIRNEINEIIDLFLFLSLRKYMKALR